jgi:hypothetical protein
LCSQFGCFRLLECISIDTYEFAFFSLPFVTIVYR